MRLVDDSGDFVELQIADYQFRRIEDEPWDSNWLQIRLNATVDGKAWTSVDPSLLTMDVETLANWLDSVADGRRVDPELDFMEPNLSFQVDGDEPRGIRMRVWFELESRPPWKKNDVAGARDFAAQLLVDSEQLRRAALDLRTQLSEFPTRAPIRE